MLKITANMYRRAFNSAGHIKINSGLLKWTRSQRPGDIDHQRGLTMNKKALRRAMGEKKRAMTAAEIEERSAMLARRLFETPAYRRAASLYVYIAFNQEVRTRPIIERAWTDGKRVASPKIVDGAMRFIWLDNFDALIPQVPYGFPEPRRDAPVADDDRALVIVPGLAFDDRGYRLGYGGGYYDGWLEAHPGHPTVALCYGFQRVRALEIEPHDMPVAQIISDD